MNYKDFYKKANEQILEALSSLWFKGLPKEQAFFRELVGKKEPLMAEPVFQTIFPWKQSIHSMAEHSSSLGLLDADFVDALDRVGDEDLRFPKDRHPYIHQSESWEMMLKKHKTVAVTSGTGSGKTECFMIPVLQDLYRNKKNALDKGVQAIFLYPLNALMDDQQTRIDAWCRELGIRYAIYNGDTEENAYNTAAAQRYYPRIMSRAEIRQNPPQVLFTNPTLLNYMLVRDSDRSILDLSKTAGADGKSSLKWILLDEAHTYTGSSASELALQIRRILDAFGADIKDVNFAVTSATISGSDPNAIQHLKEMVASLTKKDIKDIEVVGGDRLIPELNADVLSSRISEINTMTSASLTEQRVNDLRKQIVNCPELSASEICESLLPVDSSIEEKLNVIDLLSEKIPGLRADGTDDALLPTRAHFFIRALNGLFTCSNAHCPSGEENPLGLGTLTTKLTLNCPDCNSNMLEVVQCNSCGGLLVVGNVDKKGNYGMRINSIRTETELFDDPDADDDGLGIDELSSFIYGKSSSQCPRENAECVHIEFDVTNATIRTSDSQESLVAYSVAGKTVCPHCGKNLSYEDLRSFCVGANYMGELISPILLDNAEQAKNTQGTIHLGQKYITFTDSRQGTAKSAMSSNQEVERTWIRSAIYQELSERWRYDVPVGGGLTEEEEEDYQLLIDAVRLSPRQQQKLNELSAKRCGQSVLPNPVELSWNEIKASLLNSQDLKNLYEHVAKAKRRGHVPTGSFNRSRCEDYLNALYVNQMGRIPIRSNSLENLGLVSFVYPKLKACLPPTRFIIPGMSHEELTEQWRNFLKICVDYCVRESYHYIIPEGARIFSAQSTFTDFLYGPECTLTKKKNTKGKETDVKKWPQVKHNDKSGDVNQRQHRLVLLLCAALGYNDRTSLNEETVNELLKEAWKQVRDNVLVSVEQSSQETYNHGYMIDLTDSNKVKLSIMTRAWACPVGHAMVGTTFCGFSPMMSGYLNGVNFNRYKVTTEPFNFNYFPYAFGKKKTDNNGTMESVSDALINEWIDENWGEQMKKGLFSDVVRSILGNRKIYIAAEHSAQLEQAVLKNSVEDFKKGLINILCCSTTMEMGVDISGINEVVMNTVPPKPSNYLQRAGRAGRRSETKALAVTFCPATPIGNESWEHPDWPMTHPTELPIVKLQSNSIIQRHINSVLFAKSAREDSIHISVRSHVSDYFEHGGGLEQFEIYLKKLIYKTDAALFTDAESAVRRVSESTSMENISLQDCAGITLEEIQRVRDYYDSQIKSMRDAQASVVLNNSRSKYLEKKIEQYEKQPLLSYLSENGFLPSAGMPIGLVEFIPSYDEYANRRNRTEEKQRSSYPTKHIAQAISEYAPGNLVVIDEWCYESAGIGPKNLYDSTTRSIIQQCSHCKFTTINNGNPMHDCPVCQHKDTMHGVMNNTPFTETVEPVSFNVDGNVAPKRQFKGQKAGFITPKMLNMLPWPAKNDGSKYIIRSSEDSDFDRKPEILFFNKGAEGQGYAYCPICGRMVSDKEDPTINPLESHKRLDRDEECDCAGHIRRNVLLTGSYQTDFVEIKFLDENDNPVLDNVTLYSLGSILSRKLTERLGINDGEIGFGLNADYNSVFFYDYAIGGAGYSTLLREYCSDVIDDALADLTACNCKTACTKCLIDRHTQWNIGLLNRQSAIKWLQMEHDSRQAPQEAINLFGSANTLTSDISTEIIRISNSQDIASVYLFASTDINAWDAESFKYFRLLDDLKRRGVATGVVLQNNINLNALPASVISRVVSILTKTEFKIASPNTGTMKPLMSVSFSDGRTSFYFGDSVKRGLNESWGDGKIYFTHAFVPVAYTSIDVYAMITNLNAGTFVKHFYLSDPQTKANDLFKYIMRHSGGQNAWDRVKTKLSGQKVRVSYTDKHLNSPLAVFILARLLRVMQDAYNLDVDSVAINIPDVLRDCSNGRIPEVARVFDNLTTQEQWIEDLIDSELGILPDIIEGQISQHERDLVITTLDGHTELSIFPNGGIGWGWRLNFNEVQNAGDLCDDTINPTLYNKDGNILYTITLTE